MPWMDAKYKRCCWCREQGLGATVSAGCGAPQEQQRGLLHTMAAHPPGRAGGCGSREPTESGSLAHSPVHRIAATVRLPHPHSPLDWRPSQNINWVLPPFPLPPPPSLSSTCVCGVFFFSISILACSSPSVSLPSLSSHSPSSLPYPGSGGVGGGCAACADTPAPELVLRVMEVDMQD